MANEDLARRLEQRPRVLSQEERDRLLAIGTDLASVWDAPTTTARDRKELLRALIEEVIVSVDRNEPAAHLTVRWKGGAITDVDVPLPRSRPATIKTDEETVDLVRRLALLYPDTVIAGILNRQGEKRRAAFGSKPTGSAVSGPTGVSPALNPSRIPASARS